MTQDQKKPEEPDGDAENSPARPEQEQGAMEQAQAEAAEERESERGYQ